MRSVLKEQMQKSEKSNSENENGGWSLETKEIQKFKRRGGFDWLKASLAVDRQTKDTQIQEEGQHSDY
jgi:hypothetical protein